MKDSLSYNWIRELINNVIEEELETIQNESDYHIAEEKYNNLISMLKTDKMKHICELIIDKSSDDAVKYLNENMFKRIYEMETDTDEFLARVRRVWGTALVKFKLFYSICIEAVNDYNDYVFKAEPCEKESKKYTYDAIHYIHGRACQQYMEICCLMENGFADGAFARWRSLYELAIITSFICENGEDVAKAYIESATIYDRHNSWAKKAKCFQHLGEKSKISFSMIKDKVDINNSLWKKYYEDSNAIIHSNAEGTFGRISLKKVEGFIPVGRTNYGLDLPAINSAIMLAIITICFLNLIQYDEGIVNTAIINKWVDIIIDEFSAVRDSFNS